jgi:TM2 domain-containing membrane protein YozV
MHSGRNGNVQSAGRSWRRRTIIWRTARQLILSRVFTGIIVILLVELIGVPVVVQIWTALIQFRDRIYINLTTLVLSFDDDALILLD